ncbi:hypothetical protein SKAU_G00021530 [Synaphobranchus kaupii]|uniref:DUF4371 domain-containing protein n=1 Tax=Synaphobranchus kaupii TaxID=118154 RepID=A0A9Q1JDX4_SYNKA|nr:hypothetical protein SKAU_G00021530 [Synaphobranchus kaupii]
MAALALLEDIANRAIRRERVFRDRADFFAHDDEWLISRPNVLSQGERQKRTSGRAAWWSVKHRVQVQAAAVERMERESLKSSFGKRVDAAFVTEGFRNRKKALEKFAAHQKTHSHRHAVTVSAQDSNPVSVQLSSAWAKQQEEARHSLLRIVSSVQYLASQGQALRGKSGSGNLDQLLKLRSEDDPVLKKWLTRTTNYTSWNAQNEILNVMSNTVIRDIANTIRSLPIQQFSIIVDGTQDISGAEQESICLRYVDHDLVPHEEFIGLYVMSETTGQAIADMATDVLVRLNLPMAGLRGQGYDGAANMAGKYSGAQAILRRQQPLALYVHCGAHCSNLITQAACSASPLIRDSLFWVHQLGVLFGQSGKFKAMFADIATTDNQPETMRTLKPLCPTRWTVRGTAITAVLTQYDRVLCSLDKMAGSTSKSAAGASGLAEHLRKGKTVLGLTLASAVVGELECLNKSLQRRTQTVSGMLAAVDCVRSSFQEKQNDQHYVTLFEKANAAVVKSTQQIQPIEVPNARHFSGEAVDYYRVEYFKVLDTVDTHFAERFDQESFKELQKLENMLLTGQVDDVVDQYPELKRGVLAVELPLFKSK